MLSRNLQKCEANPEFKREAFLARFGFWSPLLYLCVTRLCCQFMLLTRVLTLRSLQFQHEFWQTYPWSLDPEYQDYAQLVFGKYSIDVITVRLRDFHLALLSYWCP